MPTKSNHYDVFLSYSVADRAAADRVQQALEAAELAVFDPADNVIAGKSLTDAIWGAIAVSDVFVVVLPSNGNPSPNAAAEIGAAMAWKKPVFQIRQDTTGGQSPSFLGGIQAYHISRLDDLVNAVKSTQQPLSPLHLQALRDVYLELGVPTDRLINDPALVDTLAKRFAIRTHTHETGERLLRHVIQLRKTRDLPLLKKAKASSAKRSPQRDTGQSGFARRGSTGRSGGRETIE